MKRTVLTGLFLSAALLGSPVFAADDLCGANLQTLRDAQVSSSTNLSPESKAEMKKTYEKAMAAHDAGNDKDCISLTTKAITDLKTTGSSTDGAAK
jgi:hypothetical protein